MADFAKVLEESLEVTRDIAKAIEGRSPFVAVVAIASVAVGYCAEHLPDDRRKALVLETMTKIFSMVMVEVSEDEFDSFHPWEVN